MGNLRVLHARSRRGNVAVEYAVTLFVIISISAAVAYNQSKIFAPFEAADQIFVDVASSDRNPTEATFLDSPSRARDHIFPATIAALTALGLTTLYGVRTVTRRNTEDEATADSDVDPVAAQVPDPRDELRNRIYNKRNLLLSEMSKDLHQVLEGNFQVSHLMTTKMKTCDTETPADEVRNRMHADHMHHLLVCDGPKLVGVISDRDLSKRYATRAFELMTRNPISVSPTQLLIPTISTMINKRISCLPVTVDGELKGVLTRFDILVAFQCLLQGMTKLSNELDSNELDSNELDSNELDSNELDSNELDRSELDRNELDRDGDASAAPPQAE